MTNSVAATVSVCMATYNGARFLRPQLESILAELRADDEIVIVDDASSDATREIIAEFDDPRIRSFTNERNSGYVRTFERALSLATGHVLLLSDQDDVWIAGRRDILVDAAVGTGFAASNILLLDSHEPLLSPLTRRPWLLRASDSQRALHNQFAILAGDIPYFGCAMAIRRDRLGLVLPFPTGLAESHDLWIATVANTAREMTHVEQATLYRRMHEDNASTSRPRGILPALRSRLLLVRLWRVARRRLRLTGSSAGANRG